MSDETIEPIDPIQEAAVLAYWRERSAEIDLAAASARAERAEAQLAALREAAARVSRALMASHPLARAALDRHVLVCGALDDAFADIEAAAEAYTRRVRAEALREAADACDDQRTLASRDRAVAEAATLLLLVDRLRARADEIERG